MIGGAIMIYSCMLMFFMFVLIPFAAGQGDTDVLEKKEEIGKKTGETVLHRRPLVVLRQSSISGRVFLLSQDAKDSVAEQLKIQIRDRTEQKLLFETRTDKEGRFALPNLDVGKYGLIIGRLKLVLEVREPLTGPTSARRIPKTIIVFIPEALK